MFENLLADLIAAQVEFLVVGGVAVALNGHVRSTEDIDILVRRAPENIQRLIGALAGYGEGFGGTFALEDFSDEPGSLRIYEDIMVDIFTRMNDKTFEDLQQFSAPFQLSSGGTFYFLTPQGLMELKRGSVRAKDQSDMSILADLKPEERFTGGMNLDSLWEPPPDHPGRAR